MHLVALIVQNLSDAAHPDSADADEMDRPDVARHFHCVVPLRTRLSARSASCSTALGCPSDLAASAASVNALACPSSAAKRVESENGEMVACSMIQPPPAASRTLAFAFWSASIEPGNGTSIAGRPRTVSSATDDAPDRQMTRWLCAMRSGRSVK